MKTHQLIPLTTVLFVILFYGEDMGLNFGILGIVYALLTLCKTPERNRNRIFLVLFVTSFLSSLAFAWYGDFASFLAVFTSLFLFGFKSQNKDLKSLFVIPVFAINFVTFIYRVLQLDEWLPQRKTSAVLKKIISMVVIPFFFILIFFGVYTHASKHFYGFMSNFSFDFNLWELFALACIGFFIAFNFWNFKIYNFIFSWNHLLKNDFQNEDKIHKPVYTFLDVTALRTSGIISLAALNTLLLVFICTFNYEQFVQIPKTPNQLSGETHELVNAVILSIIMAICIILFYFKGYFNFDAKANFLKVLAKIWIFLNAVLVLSAITKNLEYIINFGLTYKRMGVFAFLILAIIGLIVTYIKIQKQKTNAFLFNTMIWFFYATVLVCSYINWGSIATQYNIINKKGDLKYLESLNFNDEILDQKFPNRMSDRIDFDTKNHQKKSFLSKIIYYETIK